MAGSADTPRLPAEWAAQSSVMLTWPRPGGDWGEYLPDVERCFGDIAVAVSRRQPVIIACGDGGHCRQVSARLRDAGAIMDRIHCHPVPADDVWARDHGPITVFRGAQAQLLDFRFNGWGNKYPCNRDDDVTRALWRRGAFGSIPLERIDLVLEGGALESDGDGTLLTTRRCVLNSNRNPHLGEPEITGYLRATLGIHTIHWLDHGELSGDDTDGHIDTLARFTDPDTLVYQGCDDPDDPHYQPLHAMAEELRALRRADGSPYRLRALPLPRPVHDEDGRRLPAGYANFLIVNGAVLMPTYDDPADARAMAVLGPCFPEREIVPIDCRPLIRQYGSLHCVTMQIPVAED